MESSRVTHSNIYTAASQRFFRSTDTWQVLNELPNGRCPIKVHQYRFWFPENDGSKTIYVFEKEFVYVSHDKTSGESL